jgi:hypothetical protein
MMHDLLLREGSMPHGRDDLTTRFTRAWSLKCGRAPYPDLSEAIGCASPHLSRDSLLMAQYEGKAIIPVEQVCRDYFSHLTPPKLVQKISADRQRAPENEA